MQSIKAFAALDIGTSQIKLVVYCPQVNKQVLLIGNIRNDLIYGAEGEIKSSYLATKEKSFSLFLLLGKFVKDNNINELRIGICSHVSSLLQWDKINDTPCYDHFPIWMDSTCKSSLPEIKSLFENGRDVDFLGTFLPQGSNWLITKLSSIKNQTKTEFVFLQVCDAIHHELTSQYSTHFSAQVSVVNQIKKSYVPQILSFENLNQNHFPEIENEKWYPVKKSVATTFGFPQSTLCHSAMADFYVAFYALDLKPGEVFILTNTSEVVGIYKIGENKPSKNFVNVAFDKGYIKYGSTSTGANLINWYIEKILQKQINVEQLDTLTNQASNIHPDTTPLFIPYLEGERAPHWDNELSASFIGLRAHHTQAHLFRAVMESVAFARRQCIEQLTDSFPQIIKSGGGTSINKLWSTIRATVLNQTIEVADQKELSANGLIRLLMQNEDNKYELPELNFTKIEPDATLIEHYNKKYAAFINFQKLMSENQ